MPSVNSQVCPQNYNPQRYFSSLFLPSLSKKLRCRQVFASSKDSDKTRARAAAFHLAGIFKEKRKKKMTEGGREVRGKVCKEKWKWPTVRERPSYWRNWLEKSGLVGVKRVKRLDRPPWQLRLLTYCLPDFGVLTSNGP